MKRIRETYLKLPQFWNTKSEIPLGSSFIMISTFSQQVISASISILFLIGARVNETKNSKFPGMVYFTLAMAKSIVGKFHGPVSECFRYLVVAIFHLFFQLYQKNSAKQTKRANYSMFCRRVNIAVALKGPLSQKSFGRSEFHL